MAGRRGEFTVKDFILSHALGVPVATEADDNETFLFRHDGLVDVPAGDEMGENDGAHIGYGRGEVCLVVREATTIPRYLVVLEVMLSSWRWKAAIFKSDKTWWGMTKCARANRIR